MSRALYDRIGIGYSAYRRPDERIASRIESALRSARTILNVGAGAGSYEPTDRTVVAVDLSLAMIRQRARCSAPATSAAAERLPFRDGSFDAALAILTLHHWADWRQGLAEMRRVARERFVLLTWDPDHEGFWLVLEYFPELLELDRAIFPSMSAISALVGPIEVRPVPIPADCTDGFLGAYWRRPMSYLDAGVRGSISTFSRVSGSHQAGLEGLRTDLADGTWQRRHEALLALSEVDLGYRLVVASSGGSRARPRPSPSREPSPLPRGGTSP